VTATAGVVTSIDVDGRRVRVTNPDRVLWPRTGTRKRDLIDYYLTVAPALLPHITGRGLTLGRWPTGVEGKGWLQAECRGRPDWMAGERSHSQRTGGIFDYCVVDNRAGLVWLASLGTVELHPFISTVERRASPSFVVFDLDPGPPATVVDCARVALDLRERLAERSLVGYPKTSGMLGLHVFVPLADGHTFADTKAFARSIAAELAAADPVVTDRMSRRASRAGRILVDWLQNDPTRSTVAAYSPRAAPIPLVSTPVTWEEVERTARTADRRSLMFDMAAALGRVSRLGDLFAPTLSSRQRLPVEGRQ
jgi:bifunctional non-homologous end joining protein LigD